MSGFPNLLPMAMLARRSRRHRIRQWVGVLALEGLLVTVACVVLRADQQDPSAPARTAIESTVGQINVVSTALAASQAELQAVEQKLAVAAEVASKPDWSIVLAALAWKGQGSVTLTAAQLLPPVPDIETGASSYRLSLMGTCSSQSELTGFVQGIEATGLFSRVTIIETQRLADPEHPDDPKKFAVGFALEAWLVEGGE